MDFRQWSKQWPGLRASRTELAFSLRVTVSAVLALFVAQVLGLPMPLWSVPPGLACNTSP